MAPKYDPTKPGEYCAVAKIGKIFALMGKDLVPVNKGTAGICMCVWFCICRRVCAKASPGPGKKKKNVSIPLSLPNNK